MTTTKPPVIAFVVTCYNEEAGLAHAIADLIAHLDGLKRSKAISPRSYIVLVDDGSTDGTWTVIENAARTNGRRVRGLKLARNVGHQNALLAGLLEQIGKADAAISLDADLQDD